jgi:hypothetical protein
MDDSCDDHEYGELVDNFEHEEDDMLLFGAMGDPELNTSITGLWTLPTPENHRPIREGIIVDPVEESLLCLLIENHLPKRMYSAIMEWGHYASRQNYDFTFPPLYNTVLSRMSQKYVYVSGGPPISEIVCVPDHKPMHVYRFDFLKQVTRLLSTPDLMTDSLWGYNPQIHPDSGERVYAEMNTGDLH